MNIDLVNIGNSSDGQFARTDHQIQLLKISNLYKELSKINSDLNANFNYLIIPMEIYNIIENHHIFKEKDRSDSLSIMIDFPYYVGKFGTFDCFVDLMTNYNEVIMSYDRQISRNNKIDYIIKDIIFINDLNISITGLYYPHFEKIQI
jgi:hypothetical protein